MHTWVTMYADTHMRTHMPQLEEWGRRRERRGKEERKKRGGGEEKEDRQS